jgi:hypothetical protein
MKRLREIFNSEAFWDHAKGAVLGLSAGVALGGVANPAILVGTTAIGLLMGAEKITDMFNTAMQGRQMAYALVPAGLPKLKP